MTFTKNDTKIYSAVYPDKDASPVSHALQDCAQPGCHPYHTFPYTSKNLQRTQHEVLHPSVNSELTSILLLPKHHPHIEPAARVCRLSSQFKDLKAATAVLHPRGGGGVLRYFHTYVGSVHFFWFKILNFNIFLGFQKNEYFLGILRFFGYFLGSSQNWASLRVISMQFRVFLRSMYRIGIFFWVAKISNIFWGCLKFLIFFWGER